MVKLIGKEITVDAAGKTGRRCVYLASEKDTLPKDAPAGSRATLENGRTLLKTSSGWKGKDDS